MIEGENRGGAEREGGAEIGTEERECTQRWDMERDALTVNSEAGILELRF